MEGIMENRFKEIRVEYSEKRRDKDPNAKIYSIDEMCNDFYNMGFNISPSRVKKVESNTPDVKIDAEMLLAYKKKFNVSADWLIDNTVTTRHLTGNAASASMVTGLTDITIDEIASLSVSEKHIIDAFFSRSAISINIIKTIQEMLFYSHPLAKNNSYIKLDKSLTARDKDYEQLEMKLNESRIIDILSQRLSIEMREIIETLSKDKKLSDEILEDYRSKFFTYHRHVLTAAELPKLITDDSGNLIRDIEEHIYEMEEKILERLERRDKKGKSFDYGIDIQNYSDFKKCIQQYRLEKTKEDYLSWLEYIDFETE